MGRIGVRSGYLPFPTHVLVKAQAYPSLHLVPSIVDHRRNLLLPSFLTSLTGLGPNDHHIGFSRRLRHEARQDRACILELSLPLVSLKTLLRVRPSLLFWHPPFNHAHYQ